MSLIINGAAWTRPVQQERVGPEGDGLSQLDRYLTILQNNQHSCQFVPSDALIALDMAGFVRSQIDGAPANSKISTARLALAIVQPCNPSSIQ